MKYARNAQVPDGVRVFAAVIRESDGYEWFSPAFDSEVEAFEFGKSAMESCDSEARHVFVSIKSAVGRHPTNCPRDHLRDVNMKRKAPQSRRKLTDAEAKAIPILMRHAETGIRPKDFAREMWPESPNWKRPANRHGSMYFAGSSLLARMEKKGIVRRSEFAAIFYPAKHLDEVAQLAESRDKGEQA